MSRPFISCQICVLLLGVLGLPVLGCGESAGGGGGGAGGNRGPGGSGGTGGSDGAALHVVETTPADADTEVATDATLNAVFDDDLQATTVTTDAFTLSRGASAVEGAVSLADANTAVFTPDNPLALLSGYTATLTTGIESQTGGSLGADYEWRFTTGDGSWIGDEVMERDFQTQVQVPRIAVNVEGAVFAVWLSSNSTTSNVVARRYTPTGGWDSPEVIGSSGRPAQVAVDAGGNAFATWRSGSGVLYDGWVSRYTPTGGWGTPELIETDNAGDANAAFVAFDPNGNAMAVWVQSDGMRDRIWATSYEAGVGWGFAAGIIDGNQTYNARWPRVAMDPAGNALVVWSQSDGTRSSIWANRYVPGDNWGAAERIEASNIGSAIVPQVAFDASGNALAVWAQDVGNGNDIWSNRYAQGDGWGVAASVHANPAGPSNWPALAMNPSGEAMAVWIQDEGAGAERMWWARYTPGDGWADADGVGTGAVNGMEFYPEVTLDSNGNALTLWVQEYFVWASRYIRDEGWGVGTHLEDSSNTSLGAAPQLGIDGNGRATALWIKRAGVTWNRFE